MNVLIRMAEDVTPADSADLDQLAEDLSRSHIDLVVESAPAQPGQKDGGLTIAISVAGLALSAIGTLVSVLSYWKSTRSTPTYSVSIHCGDLTVEIEDSTAAGTLAATARLVEVGQSRDITVQISKA